MCTIEGNIDTIAATGTTPHTYRHYWPFPSVPSDFTGTSTGNRHYRGMTTVCINNSTTTYFSWACQAFSTAGSVMSFTLLVEKLSSPG